MQWLAEWNVDYEERLIGDGRVKALMVVRGTVEHPERQGQENRLRMLSGSVPEAVAQSAKAKTRTGRMALFWFGLDGQGGPRTKKYLEAVRKGLVPVTYWARDEDEDLLQLGSTSWEREQSGLSQLGIKELTAIVGPGHGFETVKPYSS